MNRKHIRNLIIEALSKEEVESLERVSNDQEELRAVWRRLLKKHHPDKAQDKEKESATATTQELNALYDKLSKQSSTKPVSGTGSSSNQKNQEKTSQKNKSQQRQMSDDEISDKIDLSPNLSTFYKFYKILADRYFDKDKDYYGYVRNLEMLIDNSKNLEFVEEKIKSLHLLGYDNDLNFRTSFLSLCYLNHAEKCLEKGKSGFADFKKSYRKAAENSYMNYSQEGQEIIDSSLEAIENIEKLVGGIWNPIKRFFSSNEKEKLLKEIYKVSSLTSHNAFATRLYHIYLK